MTVSPRAALLSAAAGLVVIALMIVLYGLDNGDESAIKVRTIHLEGVSNASGLVIITRDGERLAATVDEVSQWTLPQDPPPLITWSSLVDGHMVGGQGKVAEYGEVEGLALMDGRIIFPYKTGRQSVVLRDGDQDLPLITTETLKQLRDRAVKVAGGPLFFEFEGVAQAAGGWELLVSVVRPNAKDTPKSTMAVFRMSFKRAGGLERISPPIRHADGTLYTDYGGALDVLESGLAVVPGFHTRGVSLVDWNGRIIHHIDLPTRRVEGVFWDEAAKELILVRECVGEGTRCKDGVHFGVPLWIVHLPKGILPAE
jgi:hypothetical protein